MSRTTYPSVPDGASIGPTLAFEAAKQVRAWYENPHEDVIDTEAIVTVTRWALHVLHRNACDAEEDAARQQAYRCAYNGGTCERQACKASQRCHAHTNADFVMMAAKL